MANTPGAEDLERIAKADHSHPHAVLGPSFEEGGLVVRVFRPDALGVTVLPDDPAIAACEARRIHDGGIFEATFPAVAVRESPAASAADGPPPAEPAPSYRIEVRYAAGTFTLRDPYAFPPSLGPLDLHLAAEGTHRELYRRLGAHVTTIAGVPGTAFAVWAPNARRVSVAGDWNGWDGRLHPMRRLDAGYWELFIPDVGDGALYKYEIKTPEGLPILKADPYGRAMETRPATASKVAVRRHCFADGAWIEQRERDDPRRKPLSIYEVHLGSWKRAPRKVAPGEPPLVPEHAQRWMTYRELADELVDYVAEMGFSHVELMPVMEHPYDGSWGYQVSGYYAPTSRYGTPDDFRYFVDRCHARGIGVILDWTPAHFPKDAFALGRFDGRPLYEHADPRRGEHRHWQTYVFDFARREVKNFLVANALYWLDEFHVDGLRVDAVASMLYLDYGSSHPGDWLPNEFGGRENLGAIAFLRELNDRVHEQFPGALVIAEESTAWPAVTHPTYAGGLGFDRKWNMGWMHDTLKYFALDPIHRAFHHRNVTFGMMYAYSERFLLPLSHDEVVHLKRSLLSKMPGDAWRRRANLRALYAYMWAHPGKKLLFMGGELGQETEWDFAGSLPWDLLERPEHRGIQRLVKDINALYRRHRALYELDDAPEGFSWIDPNDAMQSVASFIRYAGPRPVAPPEGRADGAEAQGAEAASGAAVESAASPPEAALPAGPRHALDEPFVVVLCNFTPVPRHGYRVGVPEPGPYLEVLNTDARDYGGSGMGNLGVVEHQPIPSHGQPFSLSLTLPPLAVLWLVPERRGPALGRTMQG